MRITTNEEMVLRGGRVGQVAIFIGLIMVFGGLIVSFTEYKLMTVILIALGVLMYTLGNRGQEQAQRAPRLVQQLAETLNEFDDRYHLYSHVLPVDHVLLTPHGAFVLVVRGMDGRIRCFKDKWLRDITLRRLLRFFTEESLGNPSKEALKDIEKLQKYIEKHAPGVDADIQALVVFTNPEARLEVTSASAPVLPLRRLKSHIRKASGRMSTSAESLGALTRLLEEAPYS